MLRRSSLFIREFGRGTNGSAGARALDGDAHVERTERASSKTSSTKTKPGGRSVKATVGRIHRLLRKRRENHPRNPGSHLMMPLVPTSIELLAESQKSRMPKVS